MGDRAAGDVQAWAAAADGSVHAVYTRTECPCDPCDMDLYYGRAAAGGAWSVETVQPRVAGVERRWDTDSIYNSEERPITLRLRVLDVDVALP